MAAPRIASAWAHRGGVPLRQGDLLYIPRGVVHEAATTDDSSIHITLGLHVWRWADLLRESILSLAESDVRLRTSLPLGLLDDNRGADLDQLQVQLRDLLRACAETAEVRGALRRMGGRLVGRRDPVPDGHFESPDHLNTIAADTWAATPRGDAVRRRTEWTGHDRVPGGSVAGPVTMDRAFRFVAGGHVPGARLPD